MANSNFFMESQGNDCHSPTQGHVGRQKWRGKKKPIALVESIQFNTLAISNLGNTLRT